MMRTASAARVSLFPGLMAMALVTVYLIALLAAEKQSIIIGLLAVGIDIVLVGVLLRLLSSVNRSFANRENILDWLAVLSACIVASFFYDNHFVLLLVVTVLLYA